MPGLGPLTGPPGRIPGLMPAGGGPRGLIPLGAGAPGLSTILGRTPGRTPPRIRTPPLGLGDLSPGAPGGAGWGAPGLTGGDCCTPGLTWGD